MTQHHRNILSGSVAAFGVASLIYLEAAATIGSVNDAAKIAQANNLPISQIEWLITSAIIVAFGAAGVMRWYLFYEGQGLREIDEHAANVAFRWSVTLSVLVMIYAGALWGTGEIDWRTFTVFLLNVSTLSVVEWVFGRRAGANVSPIITGLRASVEHYVSLTSEQETKINALTIDLRSLTSEHTALTYRVTSLSEKLKKFERSTGRWERVGKVHLVTVCPDCGALVIVNQSAHERVCNECQLIIEKQ